MKCPLEIIGEFSEWSNTCQECSHYQECIKKCYDMEDKSPSGDNFPIHENIHHKLNLNRNRQKMVIKLLNEDTPKITTDDITDIGIDIELYNKQCRKEKIKRQYKKRAKQDDNI